MTRGGFTDTHTALSFAGINRWPEAADSALAVLARTDDGELTVRVRGLAPNLLLDHRHLAQWSPGYGDATSKIAAAVLPDGNLRLASLVHTVTGSALSLAGIPGGPGAYSPLPSTHAWHHLAVTADGSTTVVGSNSDGSTLLREYTSDGQPGRERTLPGLNDRAIRLYLPPTRDATLYEDSNGAIANGSGESLFVGVTGQGRETRALLHFDIAGSVPPSTHIRNARLRLLQNRSKNLSQRITIHAVQTSWGEGASKSGGGEGGGVPAQAGDATWLHRFHPDMFWQSAGGDFAPEVRAEHVLVAGTNHLASAGLLQDVIRWQAKPWQNHGWMLTTVHAADNNSQAMRLASDENADRNERPLLEIEFVNGD